MPVIIKLPIMSQHNFMDLDDAVYWVPKSVVKYDDLVNVKKKTVSFLLDLLYKENGDIFLIHIHI